MQDNISVIIATILFIIIIVLFPIYNVANRQDSVAGNVVVEATTSFVDDIRTKGYITANDYQAYVDKINSTGNFFDIELEVHRKILIEKSMGVYVEDYEIMYTDDIVKQLDSKIEIADGMTDEEALTQVATTLSQKKSRNVTDVCLLGTGDKIYVRVKNTNLTQAQVLLYNLFKGSQESKILVNYGGEVYDSLWATGDFGDNITSNISLSRPKHVDGQEYTMKTIAIGDDEGQYIYGIGVEVENSSDTIRFDLRYTRVKEYKYVVGADNKVIHGRDTLGHNIPVSDIIALEGFTGDVEIIKTDNNLYQILINNIKLNDDMEQSTCRIIVKEGTAIGQNDEVIGSVSSTEFIIYKSREVYDMDDIIAIQTATSRNIKTSGYADLHGGKATITFTAPETAKDGRELTGYIWNISNAGGAPIEITPKTGNVEWLAGKDNLAIPSIIKTESNEITVTFREEFATETDIQNGLAKGNYVKVRALDENGVYSKTKGVVFATIKDYMNKSISGVIATVRTLKMSGATVKGAKFNLQVSSSHGTGGEINNGDRYRIIGIDSSNRKVILIEQAISNVSDPSGKIKYSNTDEMYYIDDNGNNEYDDTEYFLASDIQLSGFDTKLGFKTQKFNYENYGEDIAADDNSLYYWVYNSLTNLEITLNNDAQDKYTSLIFDYKIMARHSDCLVSSSNISCTVSTQFNE